MNLRSDGTTMRGVAALLAVCAILLDGEPHGAWAAQGPPPSPPASDGTPVPRTSEGRPDLSGVWNKRLMVNTSRGIEPLPFTAAGLAAFNDVWNHVDPTSRCIFPGVPRVNSSPYPMQIVQLPDRVIFLYEYMHNFRVVYTDGRTFPDDWEPSLLGVSTGRWEGETLVIDTRNLTDRTWLDDHGNRHSDAMQVTERWMRLSRNQLWYEETIEDPTFYTRPWTNGWVMPLAPDDWIIMEYACTDNNRDQYEGLLQPGPLDGSQRDGSAIGQPAPRRTR